MAMSNINAANSPQLRPAKKGLTDITITNQTTKTTQPCQATGNPHPQPYLLAANQMGRGLFAGLLAGDMTNAIPRQATERARPTTDEQ